MTITVRDSHRALWRSGALEMAINISVRGWDWRLVKRGKRGDDVTLTFEPLPVAYMRDHRNKKKMRRGKVTRAEFVMALVNVVRKHKIKFFCPELHKKQPQAKLTPSKRNAKDRADNRDAGLPDGFSVAGFGPGQMRNLERVLDVGDQLDVPRKVQIAAMMCVMQESQGKVGATNGTHVGLFQQDSSPNSGWPATRDPEQDAKAFFERALNSNKAHPRQKLEDLVESVQSSGQPHEYAKWRDEAESVVSKYGGDSGSNSGSTSVTRRKPFEFAVNKDENNWGAGVRLAEEVRWRLFLAKPWTMYFMSEDDMYRSKAVTTIREGEDGVDSIDPQDDDRLKMTTVEVTCRMAMWPAPMGSSVIVEDNGPCDGKYLVASLKRSFFSTSGTITLRKPVKPKKEPAPETETVSGTGGDSSKGELYRVMKRISDEPHAYPHPDVHHGPLARLGRTTPLDCSESSSLALHDAGFYDHPVAQVSGWFAANYGKPGRGKEWTVWANAGHMFIQSEGNPKWRFDTGGPGGGNGPTLHNDHRPTGGFTPRHYPGQ